MGTESKCRLSFSFDPQLQKIIPKLIVGQNNYHQNFTREVCVVLYLLCLVPGKSYIECRQNASLFKLLKLLLVQKVLVLVTTAKVQHCLSNILTYKWEIKTLTA